MHQWLEIDGRQVELQMCEGGCHRFFAPSELCSFTTEYRFPRYVCPDCRQAAEICEGARAHVDAMYPPIPAPFITTIPKLIGRLRENVAKFRSSGDRVLSEYLRISRTEPAEAAPILTIYRAPETAARPPAQQDADDGPDRLQPYALPIAYVLTSFTFCCMAGNLWPLLWVTLAVIGGKGAWFAYEFCRDWANVGEMIESDTVI